MSREARNYRRSQCAKYDKQQTVLTDTGIKQNPFIYAETPINEQLRGKVVFCPFCLYQNKFEHYEIIDKRLVKCPNCNTRINGKTLIFLTNASIEDFAKWVYNYRLSGFFQKIDFAKWRERLKILGMSKIFWGEYNKLKGIDKEEIIVDDE